MASIQPKPQQNVKIPCIRIPLPPSLKTQTPTARGLDKRRTRRPTPQILPLRTLHPQRLPKPPLAQKPLRKSLPARRRRRNRSSSSKRTPAPHTFPLHLKSTATSTPQARRTRILLKRATRIERRDVDEAQWLARTVRPFEDIENGLVAVEGEGRGG